MLLLYLESSLGYYFSKLSGVPIPQLKDKLDDRFLKPAWLSIFIQLDLCCYHKFIVLSLMLCILIKKLLCCWLAYKQINKHWHYSAFYHFSLNNHDENVKMTIHMVISTTN